MMKENEVKEWDDYKKEQDDLSIDDAGTIWGDDINQELLGYPATIKIDRTQFSIYELKRRYQKGSITLDPDFQRENVWGNKQKSELIESVLMGIPLPLIYLAENEDGKLVVVDGRQRLTAFFEFLDDNFRLSGLNIMPELNKFNATSLEKAYPQHITTIEDFQLIVQIIKHPTPDRVRFDIFDRVNRGGTHLNNQEMRNALYQGNSTKLLRELSDHEIFQKATGYSIKGKRMKDRYIILRALSFLLLENRKLRGQDGTFYEYRSDMEDFLGKSMSYINHMKQVDIEELKRVFLKALESSFYILGEDAFRIPNKESIRKRPISMTLFETLVFYFTLYEEEEPDEKKCMSDYKTMLCNEDFISCLTYSVDSAQSVEKRFQIIKDIWGRDQL